MEVKREPKILIKVEPERAGRIVAFSSVDLVAPKTYVEVIYAFEAPIPDDACSLLAEGLRETLQVYAELAGRFCEDSNGRPAIDLNGAGAGWVKAEANVALRELMPFDPSPELQGLVPPVVGAEELLLVQVTTFKCGGIVVCTTMHHSVVDGTSAGTFVRAWATAVRRKVTGFHDSSNPLPSALHDRSALTPANPATPRFEHLEFKKAPPTVGADAFPPTVALKLHFGPKELEALKAEAMKDLDDGSWFSKFQYLTAHIWRCISRARGLSGETKSNVIISVNCRTRLANKLPDNYFGNAFLQVHAHSVVKDLLEKPLSFSADKLRQAVKRVDNDYILSVLDFIELQQKSSEPIATSFRPNVSPDLDVTNWQHLQLYTMDFGWGTPLCCAYNAFGVEGFLFLLPSSSKDGGIDAVVGVLASYAEKMKQYAFDLPCSRP